MAHSPVVLASYTRMTAAIAAHGTFTARTREVIALAVGNQNGCDYYQAAHTLSVRQVGLDDQIETITLIAREAAANRGNVSEATWQAALTAGWSADDLAEAFAHVAANLFTNYFNDYAGTELDLPPAPDLPD